MRYTFAIAGLEEQHDTVILRAVTTTFHDGDAMSCCEGVQIFCRVDATGGRPFCTAPLVAAGKARCGPSRAATGVIWPAAKRVPRALSDWARWDWYRPLRVGDGIVDVPPPRNITIPAELINHDENVSVSQLPAGRYVLAPPRLGPGHLQVGAYIFF
jgi:hypothetical protein